ncbi:MAG: phosphoribosyl transferase [Gammaproteobacteria bacterium]|jgi:predicted phosphoribosyltransferase|nr:phosphoribosyl transferase [Gammaproteobacteria bacterium]
MSTYLFKNRHEAGLYLARLLKTYQDKPEAIVLALPRGGVPVAFPIAKSLHLPLDVFIVRKIGMPDHEEFAIGALADQDICILSEDIIKRYQINLSQIKAIIERERKELKRRQQLYRLDQETINLKFKHIILVDDGIATGSTMKVAIAALRQLQVADITLAIPVAAAESLRELEPFVDQIVCPYTPEPFYAVGQWYETFDQTSDEEVLHLLAEALALQK